MGCLLLRFLCQYVWTEAWNRRLKVEPTRVDHGLQFLVYSEVLSEFTRQGLKHNEYLYVSGICKKTNKDTAAGQHEEEARLHQLNVFELTGNRPVARYSGPK